MGIMKPLAIVLIVVGVLGLVYGGFSYTQDSHNVDMGPIEMSVQEKEQVNIPVWGGVGAIGVGTLLLLVSKRDHSVR